MPFELAEGILFTDQYQLTMAQLYFLEGLHERRARFDYFFRSYPDYGRHQAGYCLFAGLEWLRTIFTLITGRQASGEPWTRMAVILGVVALVAFVSAAAFQLRPLRDWYFRREEPESEPDPAD